MSTDFTSLYWKNFLYISSAETSRKFLMHSYNKAKISEAKRKSFENSFSFTSYIEQGMSFFKQTEQSPLNIKPILLFYGLVFLVKACILTVDPNYPASSSVLAHGVSTRKRKKQNYNYLKDEVKLQKNGLFPHFSDKMFHMKHLEGDKITIESLLKEIPELSGYFSKWEDGKLTIPVQRQGNLFIAPNNVLDYYKMTADRFKTYLQMKSNRNLQFGKDEEDLSFYIDEQYDELGEVLPLRYNIEEKKYYLIRNDKELTFYPELMIHYLLLYHLGMIARYEIEWWSELIHYKPSIEYPLIVQYLNTSMIKIPLLINQYLWGTSSNLLN